MLQRKGKRPFPGQQCNINSLPSFIWRWRSLPVQLSCGSVRCFGIHTHTHTHESEKKSQKTKDWEPTKTSICWFVSFRPPVCLWKLAFPASLCAEWKSAPPSGHTSGPFCSSKAHQWPPDTFVYCDPISCATHCKTLFGISRIMALETQGGRRGHGKLLL